MPLYFAQEREVVRRGDFLLAATDARLLAEGEEVELVSCRYRTLGCMPCTGAVESTATSIEEVVAEALAATHSERQNRVVDQGADTMEDKKRDGYF